MGLCPECAASGIQDGFRESAPKRGEALALPGNVECPDATMLARGCAGLAERASRAAMSKCRQPRGRSEGPPVRIRRLDAPQPSPDLPAHELNGARAALRIACPSMPKSRFAGVSSQNSAQTRPTEFSASPRTSEPGLALPATAAAASRALRTGECSKANLQRGADGRQAAGTALQFGSSVGNGIQRVRSPRISIVSASSCGSMRLPRSPEYIRYRLLESSPRDTESSRTGPSRPDSTRGESAW